MKFFTLILTTVILFLAIKPGVDLISFESKTESSCCAGSCESKSEPQEKNKKQDGDCSGKACNPFQSCGTCFIYCHVSNVLIPEMNLVPQSKVNYWFVPLRIKNHASDFWQPPKLI